MDVSNAVRILCSTFDIQVAIIFLSRVNDDKTVVVCKSMVLNCIYQSIAGHMYR